MNTDTVRLSGHSHLIVRQRHEVAEWLGFETRNKYEVSTRDGQSIAFAAEQQKGILGFFFRQFLGHWRAYDIHFYSPNRQPFLIAHHPFRVFFQRIEVTDHFGKFLGAVQQRFSIFSKKFEIENEVGSVIMEVSSPIWRVWTFRFMRNGNQVASVQKKWSGLFTEVLTDKDNFLVEMTDNRLTENERRLMLAAALFIDLKYFEKKAGGGGIGRLFQD